MRRKTATVIAGKSRLFIALLQPEDDLRRRHAPIQWQVRGIVLVRGSARMFVRLMVMASERSERRDDRAEIGLGLETELDTIILGCLLNGLRIPRRADNRACGGGGEGKEVKKEVKSAVDF